MIRRSAQRPIAVVSTAAQFGGAEVYLVNLLRALAGRVCVEAVISDRAPEELRRRLAETGATVHVVAGLARRPSPAATLRLIGRWLVRRPALVHINLSDQGDGLGPTVAALAARLPLSATCNLVLPRRRRRLERLSGWSLRRARTVIAVSEWVGHYLRHQGASVSVIPYGIEAPRETPGARAELGGGDADFLVGGIGRLDPQKGWDVLCAAAPLVRQRVPTARFVIVGDGPEHPSLASAAAAAGVVLAGYRAGAAELVYGLDALVVPSRYEAFGLVAAEAMLAGIPVVAARVGGLPEVLGDAGLLVEPENPRALANAVLALAERPDLRRELAVRGTARARARFALPRMADQTQDVWQRVAGDLARPTLG